MVGTSRKIVPAERLANPSQSVCFSPLWRLSRRNKLIWVPLTPKDPIAEPRWYMLDEFGVGGLAVRYRLQAYRL